MGAAWPANGRLGGQVARGARHAPRRDLGTLQRPVVALVSPQ
jgi:hypothetical protein